MTDIRKMWVMIAGLVLAGCSATGLKSPETAGADSLAQRTSVASTETTAKTATTPNRIVVNDGAGPVVVQTVQFRSGVSSATVEKLAKRMGCTGSKGAGLVTEEGPVEVYRMKCENGTTFLARCELRQCRPMR